MEEASQVRCAAREAVGGTDPERLRARISEALDAGSMVPGVLVLLSARVATNNETDGGGKERGPALEEAGAAGRDDALAKRAAGVELIYDGLALTRVLASEEPWSDPSRDRTAADIEILAADVLVARGFYLLARTECAGRAVETVRQFGRDQTRRRDLDTDTGTDPGFDRGLDHGRSLEADALDLAVRCGVSAVERDVPTGLDSFAADLARLTPEEGGFPAARDFLSASVADSLAALFDERPPGVSEGAPPATDGG
jgi:hypothetical protein